MKNAKHFKGSRRDKRAKWAKGLVPFCLFWLLGPIFPLLSLDILYTAAP